MAEDEKKAQYDAEAEGTSEVNLLINTSGHVQELDRNFGLWSICGVALCGDNAWASGGGTLVLALSNGGGPGVLYGLVAATFFYVFILASLAELASAMPTSASVYHWASVTPGLRYGRICSWYAGWWNCLAYTFGNASISLSASNAIIAMYNLYHPDYVPQRWEIFIPFLVIIWFDFAIVSFGHRYLPLANTIGASLCILTFSAVTLVCAISPSRTGFGYASNSFVWTEWQNFTGWSSNGLVFLLGMSNGAFTIGTPDGASHLCEELPKPRVNIPKAMAAQLSIGFITAFFFFIAILYGVTDLDTVTTSDIVSLPLAAMFQQATRSDAGTFALLFLFAINIIGCSIATCMLPGRMLWTLARDDAVPFSSFIRHVSPFWRTPVNATLTWCIFSTILGCIYIGSATTFQAFTGTFLVFDTMSALAAILPYLLTGRKHVTPGPFFMKEKLAQIVMGIACAYIVIFNVLFMFPYDYPVANAAAMNWTSVIFAGSTLLMTLGYFWKRNHGYVGPNVVLDAHDDIMQGRIGLEDKNVVHRPVGMQE